MLAKHHEQNPCWIFQSVQVEASTLKHQGMLDIASEPAQEVQSTTREAFSKYKGKKQMTETTAQRDAQLCCTTLIDSS